MKLKTFAFLAAALSTSCAAFGGEVDRGAIAKSVQREVSENWRSEYYERQHSYLLVSPAYALEYNEGCVIYRQSFPEINGKVSFARMDFEKLYYAAASGSDCLKVDPKRFFTIQEGSDFYGTLDFVRRAYGGVKLDRDTVSRQDADRLAECFSSEGKKNLDVSRAESKPQPDADGVRYLIIFHCQKLELLEEIFVSGTDQSDETTWKIKTSVQVDVDGMP